MFQRILDYLTRPRGIVVVRGLDDAGRFSMRSSGVEWKIKQAGYILLFTHAGEGVEVIEFGSGGNTVVSDEMGERLLAAIKGEAKPEPS